jgi:hypothetical protein
MEVLKSINVFLEIPHLGSQKFYLYDISAGGMSFTTSFREVFLNGYSFDCFVEIFNGIKIPLSMKVMNITEMSNHFRVGCEMIDKSSKGYTAYVNFVNLFKSLSSFY